MVKICQTRLPKLNFEIIPKKCIFWFLPKISAGHAWSWKFFFANFQILGPLGCQGWVVIPQNVKKSQNHCTLVCMCWTNSLPVDSLPAYFHIQYCTDVWAQCMGLGDSHLKISVNPMLGHPLDTCEYRLGACAWQGLVVILSMHC